MNGKKHEGRKTLVLDSSSLISISDNCLIRVLKSLSGKEGIEFIIPESVYNESVAYPITVKKYELNAVRIRDAVQEGFIRVEKTSAQVRKRMQEINTITAGLCTCKGKKIRIVHEGETETLALVKEIGASALVIDERTTRMLIEEPENLISFLEKRHESQVKIDKASLNAFRQAYGNVKVVRSVELIALAHEDGSLWSELHESREALEAALYAAKFSGCAVSMDEIISFTRRLPND